MIIRIIKMAEDQRIKITMTPKLLILIFRKAHLITKSTLMRLKNLDWITNCRKIRTYLWIGEPRNLSKFLQLIISRRPEMVLISRISIGHLMSQRIKFYQGFWITIPSSKRITIAIPMTTKWWSHNKIH